MAPSLSYLLLFPQDPCSQRCGFAAGCQHTDLVSTVSLNTSLFTGSQSISTDSPNLSMRSIGFTNDTDSSRSSTLLHWNFFLAANYISVGK
ncbi:hypothetical protein Q8A67_010469 [Cirrhinus molitorella]|uniref:Uncharacterized protein n=1 Tax=Cirrhinus molitorella TaxID=172907 RepID=A0AA88PXH7_9TELE|nr:hypothetical protein Q8A67_010469 [Cirrhinus molitorella]